MEALQRCQQCGSASWDWLCDRHLAAHQDFLEKAYLEAEVDDRVAEIRDRILDEMLVEQEDRIERAGAF